MSSKELDIYGLKEDPHRVELALEELNAKADTGDKDAKELVESMYWETDRDRAFDRFLKSRDFGQIDKFLRRYCDPSKSKICEVGGGNGAVVWALGKSGYADVSVLEPNGHRITGTEYLREREDASDIRIWNDLDEWYASEEQYDLILTRNCVHHFQNIAMAAASIRAKIKPGGHWVMIREWYADTASELYSALREHPLCQRFKLYEWPYPASHYVECMELAGFRLFSIVPAGYADDCLASYVPGEGPFRNQRLTDKVDRLLDRNPRRTRLSYRLELFGNRYLNRRKRAYTRPQAMVFQRAELRNA